MTSSQSKLKISRRDADGICMGLTKTKHLERIAEGETNEWISLDASEIVHTFDDGWTIRRLSRSGDLRREGWIMYSCLAKYCGDVLDDDCPGRVKIFKGSNETPFDWSAREHDEFGDMEPWGMCLSNLYSLRDGDNIPHATWWTRLGSYSHNLLGSHNEPVKDAYAKRVGQWLDLVDAEIASIGSIKLLVMDQGYRLLRAYLKTQGLLSDADALKIASTCELMIMVRLVLIGNIIFDEDCIPKELANYDALITSKFAELDIDYTPWALPELLVA